MNQLSKSGQVQSGHTIPYTTAYRYAFRGAWRIFPENQFSRLLTQIEKCRMIVPVFRTEDSGHTWRLMGGFCPKRPFPVKPRA